MKKQINSAFSVLVFALLTACAQIGINPAQSLDQRLAYAYGANAAVLSTTADLVKSGAITKAEGKQVLIISDNARQVLDLARASEQVTDNATAESKLSMAMGILQSIQTYLKERQK